MFFSMCVQRRDRSPSPHTFPPSPTPHPQLCHLSPKTNISPASRLALFDPMGNHISTLLRGIDQSIIELNMYVTKMPPGRICLLNRMCCCVVVMKRNQHLLGSILVKDYPHDADLVDAFRLPIDFKDPTREPDDLFGPDGDDAPGPGPDGPDPPAPKRRRRAKAPALAVEPAAPAAAVADKKSSSSSSTSSTSSSSD